jgi:hypothetical protein
VDDLVRSDPIDQRQRQNLASVARVLQFAASGQTVESAELNTFLKMANAQFTAFFERAIQVQSPEDQYHIDEYSDVTMLTKPTIFITPREVHNTHMLFLANVETVTVDKHDPLRVVLTDLGDLPEEEEVLGDESHSDGEMSLVLTNRFEVPEDEDRSTKALLVRTKRRVIDVIRFQEGKNLKEILETPAKPDVEAQHMDHMASIKEKSDEMARRSTASPTTQSAKKALRRRSKDDGSFYSLAHIKVA